MIATEVGEHWRRRRPLSTRGVLHKTGDVIGKSRACDGVQQPCLGRTIVTILLGIAVWTDTRADALSSASGLVNLSLEQLSNIVVTSVSRREQSLADAPASVYIITNNAIRRSGVTSIPEALRLAPNLQVARADTNQYAITARGFNNVLANKLLVMIDGRTVYSPLFSGTFWEAQDVLLEDIDRIEVVSGPGATLWGANAVNGVINIITRTAQETQGALVAAGGGNQEYGGAARYGGTSGPVFFRAYAKSFHRDNSQFANGTPIIDASTRTQLGFRSDWSELDQTITFQGDAYTGEIDQPANSRKIAGANLLGSWNRRWSDGSLTRVQAYYDYTYRNHPSVFKEQLNTLDIEAQYATRIGTLQEIVVGVGYRFARDDVTNSPSQAFLPAQRNLQWSNIFVQDQIEVSDTVDFIMGVKAERNVYTGFEFLPNVRVAWQPLKGQMVWAAASRAVRSPSRIDREFYAPGNPPYVVAGNTTFDAEVANVYEIGYRGQLGGAATVTATVFATDYERLRSLTPQPGGAIFANGFEGTNTGVEAWGTWRVLPNWQLFAGVTALRERWSLQPGAVDIGGKQSLGNDPSVQWNVRSSWDPTPDVNVDVFARRVSALPFPVVPAYTSIGARVAWRPSRELEISVSGQNLADPQHAEWGTPTNRAEIQRSYFLAFLWTP